jgi:hypothetical protein
VARAALPAGGGDVSAFSHTDWFVICNGTGDDGSPCPHQLTTADLGLGDGHCTAANVRMVLRKRGWLVSVRPGNGYPRRLDFCPAHKSQAAAAREVPATQETAVEAAREKD